MIDRCIPEASYRNQHICDIDEVGLFAEQIAIHHNHINLKKSGQFKNVAGVLDIQLLDRHTSNAQFQISSFDQMYPHEANVLF